MTNSKVILITGASRGFGKLAAETLVDRGHTVIAGLRGGTERLKAVFGHTSAFQSGRLHGVDLHMEKPETFDRCRLALDQLSGGTLNVLINNAGFGVMGPVDGIPLPALRKQMEVNFFGVVGLTNLLLPALKASRGKIINVSSIAGKLSYPFYGAYCASKFALEAYTEALYQDLIFQNVTVCLIEPGGFNTDFSSSVHFTEHAQEKNSPYRTQIENFKRMLHTKSTSLSGDPKQVANLLVRLSEKENPHFRYLIGKDAWMMWLLSRVLPDTARLKLTRIIFRKILNS